MIVLRQNSVPLIRVGLGYGRSWRQHDHNAIDDDAVGTSFAGGLAHLGERALALSTRRWRGLDQLISIVAGLKVEDRREPTGAGRLDRTGEVLTKLVLGPDDKLMNVLIVDGHGVISTLAAVV
jgi:hypothetical protein